jgi:hypothetical protein
VSAGVAFVRPALSASDGFPKALARAQRCPPVQRVGAGLRARQVQIVNGSKSLRVSHPVASINPHRQPTLASAPNLRQRVGAGLRARQVQIVNGSKSLRVGHPVASINPHRQPTLASAPNLRQRVGAGLRARQVKFSNASNTFRSQITAVLRRNCAGRGMCDN